MTRISLILILLLILLSSAACSVRRIALIPEKDGNIMQGEEAFTGISTITNEEGDLTCSGSSYSIRRSLAMGEEVTAHFMCSDGRVIKAVRKKTPYGLVDEAYDNAGVKYNLLYLKKKETIDKTITEYKLKKK